MKSGDYATVNFLCISTILMLFFSSHTDAHKHTYAQNPYSQQLQPIKGLMTCIIPFIKDEEMLNLYGESSNYLSLQKTHSSLFLCSKIFFKPTTCRMYCFQKYVFRPPQMQCQEKIILHFISRTVCVAEIQIPATQMFTVKTSPIMGCQWSLTAQEKFQWRSKIPEQVRTLVSERHRPHALQTGLCWSEGMVETSFTVDKSLDKIC